MKKKCELCDYEATGGYWVKMGRYARLYYLCRKHRRDKTIIPFVIGRVKEIPKANLNSPLWELVE